MRRAAFRGLETSSQSGAPLERRRGAFCWDGGQCKENGSGERGIVRIGGLKGGFGESGVGDNKGMKQRKGAGESCTRLETKTYISGVGDQCC